MQREINPSQVDGQKKKGIVVGRHDEQRVWVKPQHEQTHILVNQAQLKPPLNEQSSKQQIADVSPASGWPLANNGYDD